MKKAILSILGLFLSITSFAQTVVGDATLPNKISIESEELILNGSGIREKLWFDLYACGLYLKNKSSNASTIVASDQPMAIHMEILSSLLSKKKLIDAFESGVAKTNSEKVVLNIASDLKKFLNFVDQDINVGDKYRLTYAKATGTSLYINNTYKGSIKGIEFKSAIFNIWLASEPVDNDLKNELLGS